MIFRSEISSLSRFERRVVAAHAVVLGLFVLFFPSRLFHPGNLPVLERQERPSPELLKIYSILRSGMGQASESAVWAVSRTIIQESRRHSFDPLLVLAVIAVESSFQHKAESPDGARGLMQIQPYIAGALAEQRRSLYGDKHAVGTPDLDNPIVNIKLGVFYLHSLWTNFRDMKLALTAYNYGPGTVQNRIDEEEEVPQEYASKVLSTYQGYRRTLHRSR
ncbi:MAG TPA: lytic transglycosylase domain-containing protein [Candidatus Binatia bacterium]|jgi:soluble lytic murein transglycosylase-like protein